MQPTNHDFLSDIAGIARNNMMPNNELLRIIALNGAAGESLSPEDRARLNSIATKADLVNGIVPESQLPSYVDNVQEFGSESELPATGAGNVIYVTVDTNQSFRWSGTGYVQIASGLVIGETPSTAFSGSRGVALEVLSEGKADKTAVADALALKQDKLPVGTAAQVIAGNGTLKTIDKSSLGLDLVDNTSDAEKPVSAPQAAAILMKENLITPSTTSHYYRGDKSWQTLNKAAIGLDNVDNTSDEDKPVSAPQRNALGVKADLLNGKVPVTQLPSYVDNVQEYATLSAFPTTGASNVVYLSVESNKAYRWGGSSYVEITSAGVALGETEMTAHRGDHGSIAYDHSLIQGNPHNTTKAQVGLGNVDNTADTNKPVSTATQAALNTKADLVDGKVPFSQLPTSQSNDTLIVQVVASSTTQYIVANIPADAPELLKFELFVPDTASGSYIGMRINENNTAIYKDVLQNVNNTTYNTIRNYSQNQLRVMSGASGEFSGRYNVRIEGTITNVEGQVKITNGTAYIAGSTPAAAPEINNFFGSAHETSITSGKITTLRFVAMSTGGTARIGIGSVLKIYGIK